MCNEILGRNQLSLNADCFWNMVAHKAFYIEFWEAFSVTRGVDDWVAK